MEITQDGGETENGPLNAASSIQLRDQVTVCFRDFSTLFIIWHIWTKKDCISISFIWNVRFQNQKKIAFQYGQ